MQAHLSTPSGRLLGSQSTFVVKATQMDGVGWIIIVVSALVLIVATVRENPTSDGKFHSATPRPQPEKLSNRRKLDDISDSTPATSTTGSGSSLE